MEKKNAKFEQKELTEEQKKEIRNNKRTKVFKYIEESKQLGLLD